MLNAMGRSTAAVYAPSAALSHDSVLLPVDERLVRPEANEEMRDGVLYKTAPTQPDAFPIEEGIPTARIAALEAVARRRTCRTDVRPGERGAAAQVR